MEVTPRPVVRRGVLWVHCFQLGCALVDRGFEQIRQLRGWTGRTLKFTVPYGDLRSGSCKMNACPQRVRRFEGPFQPTTVF
ncbi:hypothetical protein M407DRAFT_148559 [Tulasnella calospora MUT 4182]|uniref:Uncharacterized protein n=1 Tax=Tulasnella calospora MUT 4182 TaxID=1051891 RepID=A0A0C3KCZ6_9AGAM|nr:hypothetical protein M407DRAFT_148559 [Tulasnella calospora MUT 4182]